jgi:hypothetical protein
MTARRKFDPWAPPLALMAVIFFLDAALAALVVFPSQQGRVAR